VTTILQGRNVLSPYQHLRSYLGLKIDRPTLIILKMVNKRVIKLEGVIRSVTIIIMKVSTIVDFHVVLEEGGAYPMILNKPWLINSECYVFNLSLNAFEHVCPNLSNLHNFQKTPLFDNASSLCYNFHFKVF
jgi:hypothetical protein